MDINIESYNEVYLKIHCEPSIAYELNDKFCFKVPNYWFNPRYRLKVWDGTIKLFNLKTNQIYTGLLPYIERFAQKNNYSINIPNYLLPDEFSVVEAENFIKKLNPKLTPRDYQMDAFIYGIRHRRVLFLSPTASGKSFIMYLITRFYNKKTLIVVPTTNLVGQMITDFIDYGNDILIHRIMEGENKQSNKQIVVSLWQSIYKQPEYYFNQYEIVLIDECHGMKANCLKGIMEKLINCKYRFGFTGTLDDTLTNIMVMEGLTGKVRVVSTTKKLIEEKHISPVIINSLLLSYSDEVRELFKKCPFDIIPMLRKEYIPDELREYKKVSYDQELNFLYSNKKRNRFITNLALSLKGNTIILFK